MTAKTCVKDVSTDYAQQRGELRRQVLQDPDQDVCGQKKLSLFIVFCSNAARRSKVL